MLAKRIIPCLDVKAGKVVKGVRFVEHIVMGDILLLAEAYCAAGADELVFYDITASSEARVVNYAWVRDVARVINIPFCVAGGISHRDQAYEILNAGADKISINSPALENPHFIEELAKDLGTQCVVVGVDSYEKEGDYFVCQYTGDSKKMRMTQWRMLDWIQEVQRLGAGEIVLNCMNQDGVRNGYDLKQLKLAREKLTIPLVASGGAGELSHFVEVFNETDVDGALAASVFHTNKFCISELKKYLVREGVNVRWN